MKATSSSAHPTPNKRCRLDKWLWAARFFKTRSLAKNAIEGGKVRLEGQRAKAGKEVTVGSRLSIRQGFDHKEVIVVALSEKRGKAADAILLYNETPESIEKRQLESTRRKLASLNQPMPHRRPDKHDRRKIIKFNQSNNQPPPSS